jgi:ABC-type polar amino acid transport system ATPase subunit
VTPPAPGQRLLAASGLQKRYGARQVVRDVHLAVGAGEVVGLLGPNGAGKTTFFNVLTGLYTPDSGTFELALRTSFLDFNVNDCLTGLRNNEKVKLFLGPSLASVIFPAIDQHCVLYFVLFQTFPQPVVDNFLLHTAINCFVMFFKCFLFF